MEKGDKGDKAEKSDKVESIGTKEAKKGKRRGSGITVISLILVLVLIVLFIVVAQFPFKTANAVKEMVPVENCTQVDIPFASNFRTGLNYDGATEVYSSDGQAIYRYSELKPYVFANIRNTGEEKGIYCLNAQAYLIVGFTNQASSLSQFQSLIYESSDQVQQIDNWSGSRYTYPVCTQRSVSPLSTEIISLWTPALLSSDVAKQYDPKNVYILFTVIPATSQQCKTVDVENVTQQEVTKYCSPWNYVVGKC